MATQITFDTKYCKTYATLANLEKAVSDIDGRYIAAQNKEGRYYAIFIARDGDHMIALHRGHCVTN